MNKRIKIFIELFLIAIAVIAVDQCTKWIIRTNLALRETWMPIEWIEPYFRIIHWKNTGVSFGLFQGLGWIFSLVGLVVVLIIIFFYRPVVEGPAFWRIALGLQLGGALGNLIDRLNPSLGYVVDFLWFGNFPVFNVADMGVVIGAGILIGGLFVTEEKEKKQRAATVENTPSSESEGEKSQ